MSIPKLPETVAIMIDAAADKYGVPRPLARAIAWIESRGNPFAKSKAGATGVMQLMPATASQLGVTDALDAAQNIDAGVKYYAQLMARYGERLALAAYNWGPGNVSRHGGSSSEPHWPAETRNYVVNVLQRAEYELATMGAGTRTKGAPPGVAPLSSEPERLSSVLQSPAPHDGEGGEHDT